MMDNMNLGFSHRLNDTTEISAAAAAAAAIHPRSTVAAGEAMNLPSYFVPNKYTVICGRASSQHNGNEWCRDLVVQDLRKYHDLGLSRKDKTELVTSVVSQVRARNPQGGAFAKKDTRMGSWHQVTDSQARRKVLEMLQEALSKKYQARRRSETSLNQSFLGDYVSKQTAALEERKELNDDGVDDGMVAIRKRRKLRGDSPRQQQQDNPEPLRGARLQAGRLREEEQPMGRAAEAPIFQGLREEQQQQPLLRRAEEPIFQLFLKHFEASIPDSIVNTSNPFEPEPLPSRTPDPPQHHHAAYDK